MENVPSWDSTSEREQNPRAEAMRAAEGERLKPTLGTERSKQISKETGP